ncbi:MAG: hypothetical protein QXN17_02605 [Nitrososphaerota archaeon]
MKTTTPTLILPILFIVVTATILPIYTQYGQVNIDCGVLLALLNIELDYAINHDIEAGLYLTNAILNISIPTDTVDIHRQVYRALLNYFITLKQLSLGENLDNSSIATALRTLIKSREVLTSTLNIYVSRLSSCMVDREAANILGGEVLSKRDILVSDVYPRIMTGMLNVLLEPGAIDIVLTKEVFEPGELIQIRIARYAENIDVKRVDIAVWPSLIRLAQLNNITCLDRVCLAVYRAPYLSEVKGLVSGNMLRLAIVVMLSFDNRSYSYIGFMAVEYKYPNISMYFSRDIEYGRDVVLHIVVDGIYNASITLNGVKLGNVVLTPGLNIYAIPFNRTVFNVGRNTLKVSIDETPTTLPYVAEGYFNAWVAMPRIVVQIPSLIGGWGGSLPITVVQGEKDMVNISITVDGRSILNTSLGSGLHHLKIGVSFKPITRLDIKVYTIVGMGVKIPVYSGEIAVLNYTSISLLMLISLILVYAARREPTIVQSLAGRRMAIHRHVPRAVSSTTPILQIVYSVKSRVAALYYELLKRLGLPPPEFHETLREHYSRLRFRLDVGIAKYMWRLVALAERDLYSKDKPRIEEAYEVAEEVRNRGGQ